MTPEELNDFMNSNALAVMMVFMRIGTALMVLPGVGDAFVPTRIRLFLAFGVSLVMMPVLKPMLPSELPPVDELLLILSVEFLVGFLIGGMARMIFSALDVAGRIFSTMGGLMNSQLFNPIFASQGSLVGAFFIITAMALLFSTNLHHMVIRGMFFSYDVFPFGEMPDIRSLAETMATALSKSFELGFMLAAPIVIVGLLLHILKALFARLVPQIQVLILFLPAQITIGLITLMFVTSTVFLFWLEYFEAGMSFLFR